MHFDAWELTIASALLVQYVYACQQYTDAGKNQLSLSVLKGTLYEQCNRSV